MCSVQKLGPFLQVLYCIVLYCSVQKLGPFLQVLYCIVLYCSVQKLGPFLQVLYCSVQKLGPFLQVLYWSLGVELARGGCVTMDLPCLAFTARLVDLSPVQGLYMTGLDLASLPQALFRHLPMLRLPPVRALQQYWI